MIVCGRTVHVSEAEREHATALIEALREVQARAAAGERDANVLQRLMSDRIRATPGAELDYAEIVDADRFRPVDRLNGPAVAAVAVRFGKTRLIDNVDLP